MSQEAILKERIYKFLDLGAVSFVELEDKFGHGDFVYEAKTHTCYWFGLPLEVIEALIELKAEKKILLYPAPLIVYLIDGRVPKVPIAKSDRDYKTDRWLPVVIWRTDMLKGRLDRKEAKIYRAAGWDV